MGVRGGTTGTGSYRSGHSACCRANGAASGGNVEPIGSGAILWSAYS